jgi:hypothetical protein
MMVLQPLIDCGLPDMKKVGMMSKGKLLRNCRTSFRYTVNPHDTQNLPRSWLIQKYPDDLLLKSSQLKALGPPLKHNHKSLFHWIEGKKPVMEQEDDWILHEDDLVGLSEIDHLESSLASSFLNVCTSVNCSI